MCALYLDAYMWQNTITPIRSIVFRTQYIRQRRIAIFNVY